MITTIHTDGDLAIYASDGVLFVDVSLIDREFPDETPERCVFRALCCEIAAIKALSIGHATIMRVVIMLRGGQELCTIKTEHHAKIVDGIAELMR